MTVAPNKRERIERMERIERIELPPLPPRIDTPAVVVFAERVARNVEREPLTSAASQISRTVVEQVANGVTGFLVEPGNAASMAEAIGDLLESPERARLFGQNGRQRFLERFEFEPFYHKMLSLYKKVMAQ